jgi:hypothetical protein
LNESLAEGKKLFDWPLDGFCLQKGRDEELIFMAAKGRYGKIVATCIKSENAMLFANSVIESIFLLTLRH